MCAFYDYREKPNPKGDGEKQPIYPRIVSSGTITTKKLIQSITTKTTFTVSDLYGAITAITEEMAYYLSEGYHVQLGDIGYFSAKLKARPVMNRKETHAGAIRFDNVNFRASARFRKRIGGRLTRAPEMFTFRISNKLSREECLKRLTAHLDENGYITRKEYSEITGRLKNKALEDLRSFVEEGLIQRKGRGNSLFFVPVK